LEAFFRRPPNGDVCRTIMHPPRQHERLAIYELTLAHNGIEKPRWSSHRDRNCDSCIPNVQ